MKADKMSFETLYGDGSGVEFAVRLDNDDIQIEATASCVELPVMKLDWLISALQRIQDEVRERA